MERPFAIDEGSTAAGMPYLLIDRARELRNQGVGIRDNRHRGVGLQVCILGHVPAH